MSDLRKTAATSMKGGVLLFVGNTVALLVNAVGALLVALMLSPSEYGIYSVSLILPSMFILFSDWGINPALVQFIARSRSQGKTEYIRDYQKAGFIFKVMTGGILSLSLWILSDVLAYYLLGRPEIGELVRLASVSILFQPIYQTTISVLTGYERMDYRATVSVIHSLVKGISAPLLVYYGFGVSGAILGHVSSYAVAAGLGFLLSFKTSIRYEQIEESIGTIICLKEMIGYGLPLFLGNIVGGLTNSFRGFLMSWFVSDEIIGNYSVASRFMSLIGLVTGSIGVTLFPAFSKFNYKAEPVKTREAFRASIKYASMIIIPLNVLLAVVSEPLIYTLYGLKYPLAPGFFLLLLMPMILVGTGSLSMRSFFNSQGDTRVSMKVGLIGSVVSILFSPIMVWVWGIPGLIISIFIASLASNLLGLFVLRENYSFYPDLAHMVRLLLCSALSAGSSIGVLWLLSLASPFFNLLISSAIFLLTFLIFAPIMRVIKKQDIVNLDAMLKELGVIYLIARVLFDVEEKIISYTQ